MSDLHICSCPWRSFFCLARCAPFSRACARIRAACFRGAEGPPPDAETQEFARMYDSQSPSPCSRRSPARAARERSLGKPWQHGCGDCSDNRWCFGDEAIIPQMRDPQPAQIHVDSAPAQIQLWSDLTPRPAWIAQLQKLFKSITGLLAARQFMGHWGCNYCNCSRGGRKLLHISAPLRDHSAPSSAHRQVPPAFAGLPRLPPLTLVTGPGK